MAWTIARGLLLLLLVLPIGVAAARDPLEPPDLSRYLRWGPLRARPGIEVRNLGHDDNILSSATAPVDDITGTVSPRLEGLLLLGGRGFVEFVQRFDFTAYADNRDQGYVNEVGSLRATFPLHRFGLFVDGLRNRIQERPVDLEDIRPERDEDGYGVGLIFTPGWRTDVELGWSGTRYEYSDRDLTSGGDQTIAERLDRDTSRTTASLRYRAFGRTSLTLESWRKRIGFSNPTSDGTSKDSTEWAVLPGIDFGEDGTISGSVRVGRQEIDAIDSTLPDFSATTGRAEVAYRPTGRTTLRLEAFREPGFTVTEESVYYLHGQYGLRAVHYVHRSVGLEAGASVGRLTFPGGLSAARTDDLVNREIGVRLRLGTDSTGKRLEYSLRVGRFRRDSSLDSLDRSRTTIGLGAVLGF